MSGAGAGLGEVLGHAFRDPDLPRAVASPPAAGGDSRAFERLEFLGDRVFALLLAEALLRGFPRDREGPLADRISALASGETMAGIADESGLTEAVGGAQPELRGSVRARAGLLEAAFGALYLDGGLEAARGFFGRFVLARLAAMREAPRDPKMALQEWAERRGRAPPRYETGGTEGPDHRRTFRVRATLEGGESAEGAGTSRRAAEKRAAAALLARVGDR